MEGGGQKRVGVREVLIDCTHYASVIKSAAHELCTFILILNNDNNYLMTPSDIDGGALLSSDM